MKHILAVSALVLAVAPAAFASKARIDALNKSRHLVDLQTAFDRPYQFMDLKTQATIEWGNEGNVFLNADGKLEKTNRGEAGFLVKNDDYAWGIYFGRRAESFGTVLNGYKQVIIDMNSLSTDDVASLMEEQNPISAYYATKTGDWTWGIAAKYSHGEVDATQSEVTSAGFSLGASNGKFTIDWLQGLKGVTQGDIGGDVMELESKGMSDLTVGYHINDMMEVYAGYALMKADLSYQGDTTEAVNVGRYKVGFVHQLVKNEEMNVFYGVAYMAGKTEKLDAQLVDETQALPVWMGVEKKATDSLVLRGSITQNVFLNKYEATDKTATPAIVTESDLDSLKINAGIGYKVGPGMLDGNITSVKQGTLGFSDDLITQVSYTFNFDI